MSIFQIVKEEAGSTPRSYEWYRETVRMASKMSNIYESLVDMEETLIPSAGNLYLFEYKAVYANKMKFYDRFPLVYVTSGGKQFKGINLHYLGLRNRLNVILNLETGSMPSVPPNAYHNYLTDGLETPMFLINKDDYKTAAFLPLEDFGGMSKTAVWNGAKP